ncbi:uncharacterized protein LOC6556752 isoform X2 [Drosophila grimshawi]|uniref:uncharacterized protein LOC6556752 isoform X2 n=1 Tax=Drosophila grimshawi TaxID=7222 RepID=UPI001C9337D5|nr:uncharacterized protein LOC6556752 isoform X2 [Drosophila grimshawi]
MDYPANVEEQIIRDEKNDNDHSIAKLRDSVSLVRKMFLIYGSRFPEEQCQKLECLLKMLESKLGTSDFSCQFQGNKLDKIMRVLNNIKEKFVSLLDDEVIVIDDTPDQTDLQSTIEGEHRFNPSPPQFPIATTVRTNPLTAESAVIAKKDHSKLTRALLDDEVIVIDDTPDPTDLQSTIEGERRFNPSPPQFPITTTVRTNPLTAESAVIAKKDHSDDRRSNPYTIATTISNSEANCIPSIFQRRLNPPSQPVTTFSGDSSAIAETDNVDGKKLVALHGSNCNDPRGRKYTYQNPTLSTFEQRMDVDDELENAEQLPDRQKSKEAAEKKTLATVDDSGRNSVRNIVNGKRCRRVSNLSLNEEQVACKKRILARLEEAPATAAIVNKRQRNTPVKLLVQQQQQRQQQLPTAKRPVTELNVDSNAVVAPSDDSSYNSSKGSNNPSKSIESSNQNATSGQIPSPDGTFINYASGLGLRITRVFSLRK